MSIYSDRPALRWGVPVLAVAVLAGAVGAYGARSALASSSLPHRTAAQLLVDVQQAHVDGLSGTVVESANLGLPTIPTTDAGGAQGSSSLSSLLGGTHTMRVWSSGPTKSRVALLGSLGESDVVRNGSDVWIWSSKDRTASHLRLPAKASGAARAGSSSELSARAADEASPGTAAKRFLALIGPTTTVSTDGTASVAGRSAYELVLSPKTKASLVASVRIAIDAKTHIPLRLQVYSTKLSKPAIELAYSSISIGKPDDSVFRFDPPAGTKVTNRTLPTRALSGTAAQRAQHNDAILKALQPTTVGKSWSSVLKIKVPMQALAGMSYGAPGGSHDVQQPTDHLRSMLGLLPTVSGSWGSGKLLSGTLASALLTDDGRLLVGAVTPQTLYAAAAK